MHDHNISLKKKFVESREHAHAYYNINLQHMDKISRDITNMSEN